MAINEGSVGYEFLLIASLFSFVAVTSSCIMLLFFVRGTRMQ